MRKLGLALSVAALAIVPYAAASQETAQPAPTADDFVCALSDECTDETTETEQPATASGRPRINATRGFSEQFFGPGVSEGFAQSLIAFNKQVALEDDELTDSVQRGLLGGLPERGRFLANSEQLVIHFQKMVVRALSGSSPI